MNVLVTGANGFIGKNLIIHLNELGINTMTYTRENSIQDLPDFIKKADFIGLALSIRLLDRGDIVVGMDNHTRA
jgi:UDP-2-acetamido-2,6-beta-L-arabino-hexul-4-ose reductase